MTCGLCDNRHILLCELLYTTGTEATYKKNQRFRMDKLSLNSGSVHINNVTTKSCSNFPRLSFLTCKMLSTLADSCEHKIRKHKQKKVLRTIQVSLP